MSTDFMMLFSVATQAAATRDRAESVSTGRPSRRWPSMMVLAICVATLAGFASGGETARTAPLINSNASTNSIHAANPSEKQKRLREGTVFNERLGQFRSTGEMFWFREKNDGREFRVLENLALERIARALPELPQNRTWAVTGILTEYQGENYLLLTRAVLKSVADSAGGGTVE